MTPAQTQWLNERRAYKAWYNRGIVSALGWTDVGYVFPDGRFVLEGKHHGWARPMRLMSSGEALVVLPPDAIKVGREYAIV